MEIVRQNNNRAMVQYAAAAAPLAAKGAMKLIEYAPAAVEVVKTGAKALSRKGRRLLGRYNEGGTVVVGGRNTVSAPVAISRRVAAMKPRFTTTKGKVHLVHRELVASVNNTTGALQVNGGSTVNGHYRINPSNARLFTWLPTIASNFDSYKLTRVRFLYVPMCATTETGRISLVWDKDSQDPPPVDRAALSAYSRSNEGAPWCEVGLVIPTDNVVRFVNDTNTNDRKLVDLGQLLFAVYGGGSTNTIGDIYVEYGVEFTEAQPSSNLTQDILMDTGNPATTSGPEYVTNSDITMSATVLNINLTVPGMYLWTLALNTTAATNVSIGGNSTAIGTIRGGTTVGSALFAGVLSCTGVSGLAPSIVVNGLVGLGRMQLMISKCSPGTSYAS